MLKKHATGSSGFIVESLRVCFGDQLQEILISLTICCQDGEVILTLRCTIPELSGVKLNTEDGLDSHLLRSHFHLNVRRNVSVFSDCASREANLLCSANVSLGESVTVSIRERGMMMERRKHHLLRSLW